MEKECATFGGFQNRKGGERPERANESSLNRGGCPSSSSTPFPKPQNPRARGPAAHLIDFDCPSYDGEVDATEGIPTAAQTFRQRLFKADACQ
jgi:hypothetical protein